MNFETISYANILHLMKKTVRSDQGKRILATTVILLEYIVKTLRFAYLSVHAINETCNNTNTSS